MNSQLRLTRRGERVLAVLASAALFTALWGAALLGEALRCDRLQHSNNRTALTYYCQETR